MTDDYNFCAAKPLKGWNAFQGAAATTNAVISEQWSQQFANIYWLLYY